MAFLADFYSWWDANSTLTALIPSNSIYTGIVPGGNSAPAMPYVVLVPLASVVTDSTGDSYYEDYYFQLSIFAETAAEAESLGATITSELDHTAISASAMRAMRQSRQLIAEQGGAYHLVLEYRIPYNH